MKYLFLTILFLLAIPVQATNQTEPTVTYSFEYDDSQVISVTVSATVPMSAYRWCLDNAWDCEMFNQ